MTRLSIERLFSDPPLTGTLPGSLQFAADGSYVAYLQLAPDDRERMDLWRWDRASAQSRCWVEAPALTESASTLTESATTLTAAEKAERERKRQFSHGITRYELSATGAHVLICADGTGYLLEVATELIQPFTPPGTRQTDLKFSATGKFVSYVRDNNLMLFDVVAGAEFAVTTDGSAVVSNGIADFIAAEEMHRFEGHWWAEDDSAIAFTRVDQSTVAASQRYEIDADEFNVIEQRYPYAGAANARVQLLVYSLATRTIQEIDYQDLPDDYLARVGWSGEQLALQVQSRDQQSLRLNFHHPATGAVHTALKESSPSWINLHDNFHSIDPDRFIWSSERDGHAHLYLYSNGEPHQLTRGHGQVNKVVHIDTKQVLFTGWFESPTEQHLYSVPLTGGEPHRLTETNGWHEVTVDTSGHYRIDRATSTQQPGSVVMSKVDGTESTTLIQQVLDQTHPYFPHLDAHCEPEFGEVRAQDGQVLYYRLTAPKHIDKPCPLVVQVYGGPGVQRVKNEWPPFTLQLFAQRGFGVLELDNRGASNRGRDFEAPIYRQLGRVEVADQITGARFAQSLDWVDADRIGVFGHSYGGYMTLMCLARAPDLFRAGVAVAPVTDWHLYDTHYTERYLSTPADNSTGYAASSVFSELDNLRGKLLIMHGMADDNVLFTHSTKLFKALQAKNISFEMMTYPGAKHGLQERDVSIHRFNLIMEFFERSL